MSARRPSISINGAVGRRLEAHCRAMGISMSQFVERATIDVIEGRAPIPDAALERGRSGTRWGPAEPIVPPSAVDRARRAHLDGLAATRRALLVATEPPPGVLARREIWVKSAVIEAVQDQVSRLGDADPGDILDAAISRMLDSMARVPWCRFCLERYAECECRARRSA